MDKSKCGQSRIFGDANYITDATDDYAFCGLKERPSVFNKISLKIDWIRETVNHYVNPFVFNKLNN